MSNRSEKSKRESTTRVVFAGGGTGGHLYPGLAIAKALVERAPFVEPFFVGAQRGIERDILPSSGFPYLLLDLHPLYRRSPHKNVLTLKGAVSSWKMLDSAMHENMPLAVVGTGGYAAGLSLMWAKVNKVPIALHEPDSFPGLTTRLFARWADLIMPGFPEAINRLTTRRDSIVNAFGAPVERPTTNGDSKFALKQNWGFPPDSFVVLVVGGSQGARAVNEAVAQWCENGLPAGVAVIWATGKSQVEPYLRYESDMVRVRPYLSPISLAYAASDMAIARAGAMTIAELCVWGIPSILIPLPSAAQNHQSHNATTVAAAGAAVHMPQSQLTAALLNEYVMQMQKDGEKLSQMREAALRRARPNAANDIAEAIVRLVGEGRST